MTSQQQIKSIQQQIAHLKEMQTLLNQAAAKIRETINDANLPKQVKDKLFPVYAQNLDADTAQLVSVFLTDEIQKIEDYYEVRKHKDIAKLLIENNFISHFMPKEVIEYADSLYPKKKMLRQNFHIQDRKQEVLKEDELTIHNLFKN